MSSNEMFIYISPLHLSKYINFVLLMFDDNLFTENHNINFSSVAISSIYFFKSVPDQKRVVLSGSKTVFNTLDTWYKS